MTASSRPWASVVIPIKDERDNLVPLTEQLLKVLGAREESRTFAFEILYVDDGSSDGSSDVLDRLAVQHPEVKVFHLDRNYGQSAAFDAGFRHSTGSIVITMDGDLQNDPADITTLLPLIRTYDLVCGWRINRHDNLMRKISSWVANIVQSAVMGDRVHDTGCSLKIFRRAVVDRITLFNGMHRFFPALVLREGGAVQSLPVNHRPRLRGRSKYGVLDRLLVGIIDWVAARARRRSLCNVSCRL